MSSWTYQMFKTLKVESFVCLFEGEEEGGRPPMDSSRRRMSGALENSGNLSSRGPMVWQYCSVSLFSISLYTNKHCFSKSKTLYL